MYSLQDWFFRIEFVAARLNGTTVAEVLDDGSACEDHIVLVDTSKITSGTEMEQVLQHELLHALMRWKVRPWRTP